MVLYSSYGNTQICVSMPAFVVVRTFGPFDDKTKLGKTPEKSARFELNKGHLSLGLHQTAATFQILDQKPVRGNWSVRHRPFKEEQLAKGREIAARLQLRPEMDSAMIG